jgi:hypothetical protein
VATVAVIVAAFVIIIAMVTVVVVLFVAAVIIATCWMIGPRNPGDVVFVPLFGLFRISVLIGHLKHLTNRLWRHAVEFGAEFIVVIEPTDECGDNFIFEDVGDAVHRFRETPNVAAKKFAGLLVYPFQVMLDAWSLACTHVILDEHPLEIIPRPDGIRPQTGEPVHSSGLKHNWQIICHRISASSTGPYGNGVACEPLVGVGLAIILLNPRDLEGGGPLDGPQCCCKSARSLRITDDSGGVASSWQGGVAGGVTGVGRGNQLESSVGVAPFSVILLSVSDLFLMT